MQLEPRGQEQRRGGAGSCNGPAALSPISRGERVSKVSRAGWPVGVSVRREDRLDYSKAVRRLKPITGSTF